MVGVRSRLPAQDPEVGLRQAGQGVREEDGVDLARVDVAAGAARVGRSVEGPEIGPGRRRGRGGGVATEVGGGRAGESGGGGAGGSGRGRDCRRQAGGGFGRRGQTRRLGPCGMGTGHPDGDDTEGQRESEYDRPPAGEGTHSNRAWRSRAMGNLSPKVWCGNPVAAAGEPSPAPPRRDR